MDVEILARKGLNAICAEMNGQGEVVFTWGLGLLEVKARAHASIMKINLMHAASDSEPVWKNKGVWLNRRGWNTSIYG